MSRLVVIPYIPSPIYISIEGTVDHPAFVSSTRRQEKTSAMSALMSTPALVVGVLLALLYGLYRAALPKPIPGIPYNKESANRLMGDLPHLMASKKAGEGSRAAFTGLGTKLGSPLTQFFVGPFAPPLVVLSDFREMQDLIVRRSRDLERGPTQRHAWGGIIPEHFIGMDDHDHRFKDAKSLTRDLMTPSFLHEVSL